MLAGEVGLSMAMLVELLSSVFQAEVDRAFYPSLVVSAERHQTRLLRSKQPAQIADELTHLWFDSDRSVGTSLQPLLEQLHSLWRQRILLSIMPIIPVTTTSPIFSIII
jgi:hypothetical protein